MDVLRSRQSKTSSNWQLMAGEPGKMAFQATFPGSFRFILPSQLSKLPFHLLEHGLHMLLVVDRLHEHDCLLPSYQDPLPCLAGGF